MTLGDYADALGFVEKGGPSIRRGAGRAEPFLRTTLQGPSEIQLECARKGSRFPEPLRALFQGIYNRIKELKRG